ncbi:MAG: hypothetical protein KF708_15330 [Pirellulales bacterium]|nr:hypothetical protein [Pirellulales bacterium]
MEFDRQAFGPAAAALLPAGHVNDLGPGRPNSAVRASLEGLTVDELFAGQKIVDGAMARCCLSALWLYHDYLDESHALSQEIETPSGSYWHGIMHRREPDSSNAKYWFRRVRQHEIFPALAADARQLAAKEPGLDRSAEFLREQTEWAPNAFVDLCEHARLGRSPAASLCQAIQEREWQLLFTHCFRGVVRG